MRIQSVATVDCSKHSCKKTISVQISVPINGIIDPEKADAEVAVKMAEEGWRAVNINGKDRMLCPKCYAKLVRWFNGTSPLMKDSSSPLNDPKAPASNPTPAAAAPKAPAADPKKQ